MGTILIQTSAPAIVIYSFLLVGFIQAYLFPLFVFLTSLSSPSYYFRIISYLLVAPPPLLLAGFQDQHVMKISGYIASSLNALLSGCAGCTWLSPCVRTEAVVRAGKELVSFAWHSPFLGEHPGPYGACWFGGR